MRQRLSRWFALVVAPNLITLARCLSATVLNLRLLLPQCFQRLSTNAKSHPKVALNTL